MTACESAYIMPDVARLGKHVEDKCAAWKPKKADDGSQGCMARSGIPEDGECTGQVSVLKAAAQATANSNSQILHFKSHLVGCQ